MNKVKSLNSEWFRYDKRYNLERREAFVAAEKKRNTISEFAQSKKDVRRPDTFHGPDREFVEFPAPEETISFEQFIRKCR